MAKKTQVEYQPGTTLVHITREFDAPRALLFRAHTDPDLFVQWMGPRNLTMDLQQFEPRDGGKWRYVSKDEAGNEYGFHGVFHGDPSPENGIVQTFEFEGAPGHVSLEKLIFEERDDKTILHGVSVFTSLEAVEGMLASGMEAGMNESYDRLDELVAALVATTS